MKKKSIRKTCKKFKPFQSHGKTSINDLAENIEKPKVVSRETKIRNSQFNLLKKNYISRKFFSNSERLACRYVPFVKQYTKLRNMDFVNTIN